MKKIGITCDDYKVPVFRKGLQKDGYTIEFDGESGVAGVHLFRILVAAPEFASMQKRISKTIARLEIECKQSN